jgi:hypothetical protein
VHLISGVFDEDNSAIFVRTTAGVFMVHLGSMRFKDLSSSMGEQGAYYPFTSFCATGNNTHSLLIAG